MRDARIECLRATSFATASCLGIAEGDAGSFGLIIHYSHSSFPFIVLVIVFCS